MRDTQAVGVNICCEWAEGDCQPVAVHTDSPEPAAVPSSFKMWLKLFFLLLYFIVLFMLARIFEAVVWYETGVFATQLVDPVTLSYKKLKTILECRGLGYSGLAEKKDVSELVEKSGTSL